MLKSGKLGVLKSKRLVAEIEDQGALFGEMSVILDQPRSATVKVLTSCVVEVYNVGIDVLARDHPHIVKLVLRTLAERLAGTTARLHYYMSLRDEHEVVAPGSPIVSFRDVTAVDDRIIQRVISSVRNDDLVAALLGTTPRVRSKFFKNMSRRRIGMLQEDMHIAIGICTRRAIELAQQRILEMIEELLRAREYIHSS